MPRRADLIWPEDYNPSKYHPTLDRGTLSLVSDSVCRAPRQMAKIPMTFHAKVLETEAVFETRGQKWPPYAHRKWAKLVEVQMEDDDESGNVRESSKTTVLTAFGAYATNLEPILKVGDVIAMERPTVVKRSGVVADNEAEYVFVMGNNVDKQGKAIEDQTIIVLKRVEEAVKAFHEIKATGRRTPKHKGIGKKSDMVLQSPSHTIDVDSPSPTRDRRTPRTLLKSSTPEATSRPITTSTPTGSTGSTSSSPRKGLSNSASRPTLSVLPMQLQQNRPDYVYTTLNNCASTAKGCKYNTWAIVTNVARLPSRTTNGSKLMARVYIRDPDFQGTNGKPDLQFSLMGLQAEDFPPIIEGSTMRIHHMEMQPWGREITGRVFTAKSVTVIKNDDLTNDAVAPVATMMSDRFTFTDDDVATARCMRRWWRGVKNELTSHEGYKTLEQIRPETTFHLCGKVVEKKIAREGKMDVLRVTDGTNNVMSLLHLKTKAAGSNLFHVADVFSKEKDFFADVNVGSFVCLKSVRCEAVKFTSDEGCSTSQSLETDAHKLVMNLNASTHYAAPEVVRLDPLDDRAKAVALRLKIDDEDDDEDVQVMDMDSLLEELERDAVGGARNINGSQDSDNMFPDNSVFKQLITGMEQTQSPRISRAGALSSPQRARPTQVSSKSPTSPVASGSRSQDKGASESSSAAKGGVIMEEEQSKNAEAESASTASTSQSGSTEGLFSTGKPRRGPGRPAKKKPSQSLESQSQSQDSAPNFTFLYTQQQEVVDLGIAKKQLRGRPKKEKEVIVKKRLRGRPKKAKTPDEAEKVPKTRGWQRKRKVNDSQTSVSSTSSSTSTSFSSVLSCTEGEKTKESTAAKRRKREETESSSQSSSASDTNDDGSMVTVREGQEQEVTEEDRQDQEEEYEESNDSDVYLTCPEGTQM